MVTKNEILEKLTSVNDPELGMNIVDLGLVYEVDVRVKKENEFQKIFIKMTFTTPACPMINEMLHEIQAKLDEIKELDVELTVVFDPPWTPEMMTDRAKIKLGII
ncbi:metal-sulfur cluster assembly factor [Candidatus Micrarchaeota archaeon]|nr:metal-sulfur cluster assembly factor [Candidatus Micrarchaeota archaeon]